MFSLPLRLLWAAGQDLHDDWNEAAYSRKTLYFAGLLLLASGLFHSGVFWWTGGSWEGPLSWRKPILFGISGGLTTLSLAWVIGLVKRSFTGRFSSFPPARLTAFESFFCWSFALSLVGEVALITLQTWRGVPSHFNQSTPLNAAIFFLMGALILWVTLQIFILTGLSFFRLEGPRDLVWATRLGLLLLILACLLGVWLVDYGVERVTAGQDPEIYGAHGVMKFPHGLPMHAIQYLMVAAWLQEFFNVPARERVLGVVVSGGGLLLLTLYGLVQTLQGRARFDFTPSSAALFLAGLILFTVPYLLIGREGLRSWRLRTEAS